MKESRYIELLNLYVDNQLTPAEAAELETEVQSSPERRRTYSQYCRMQKACTLLFEADRSLAPKTAAAVMAIRNPESRVLHRRDSLFGWRGLRLTGWATAAACAVFIGVRFLPDGPASSPDVPATLASTSRSAVAQSAPQPAESVAIEFPALPSQRSALQSVWAASSLRTSRDVDVLTNQGAVADLTWLTQVNLPAVGAPRVEDLRFEARAESLSQPDGPVYVGRRPFQGNVEMTAFQFQR